MHDFAVFQSFLSISLTACLNAPQSAYRGLQVGRRVDAIVLKQSSLEGLPSFKVRPSIAVHGTHPL